jgi:hypothetical protein
MADGGTFTARCRSGVSGAGTRGPRAGRPRRSASRDAVRVPGPGADRLLPGAAARPGTFAPGRAFDAAASLCDTPRRAGRLAAPHGERARRAKAGRRLPVRRALLERRSQRRRGAGIRVATRRSYDRRTRRGEMAGPIATKGNADGGGTAPSSSSAVTRGTTTQGRRETSGSARWPPWTRRRTSAPTSWDATWLPAAGDPGPGDDPERAEPAELRERHVVAGYQPRPVASVDRRGLALSAPPDEIARTRRGHVHPRQR